MLWEAGSLAVCMRALSLSEWRHLLKFSLFRSSLSLFGQLSQRITDPGRLLRKEKYFSISGGWEVQCQGAGGSRVWGEPAFWFTGFYLLCPHMAEKARDPSGVSYSCTHPIYKSSTLTT